MSNNKLDQSFQQPHLDIDSLLINASSSKNPIQSFVKITIICGDTSTGQFQTQVDQFGDFDILKKQLIDQIFSCTPQEKPPQQNDHNAFDIQLKLASGGLVERCAALMEGDIVYITFKSPTQRGAVTTKQAAGNKRKEIVDLESTMIGAYEASREVRDGRYQVKEMDFKHLECMIMTIQARDQQDLVKTVNSEWAQNLGFQMKQKRPAKINKDGSKTMRLYCTHHNSLYTQEEFNMIKQSSGLDEESCFFGLTFRFVPNGNSGVWILYESYEQSKHCHTHPFFYKCKTDLLKQAKSITDHSEVEIVRVVNSVETNQYSQASNIDGHQNSSNPIKRYYQIYKSVIERMASMDQILSKKASGIIIPPRRGGNQFPYFGNFKSIDQQNRAFRRPNPSHLKRYLDDRMMKEQSPERYTIKDFEKLLERFNNDQELVAKGSRGLDENQQPKDIFYQTALMKTQYELFNDFIFINRRIVKTRFMRNLVMVCGVSNEGRTLVFGVGLIKEDTQDSYKFVLDQFFETTKSYPQAIIIERVSQLKNAVDCYIKESKNKINLLYCPHHLQKSLKFQIKQLITQREGGFSDKLKQLLTRVERLPKIEGVAQFKKELDECRSLSINEQIKKQCSEIGIIVDKIYKESAYWARHIVNSYFTSGVNVYERTDIMKLWFQRSLSKMDVKVDESIDMLFDFSWLDLMQTQDMTQDKLSVILGKSHSLIMDMEKQNEMITYDEFKVTKSNLVDSQPIVSKFLEKRLTNCGVERSRYAIGQATKYYRITQGEKDSITFLITYVNPNHVRDQQQNANQIQDDDKKRTYKLKIVGDYIFCACMEYFNTGLPCPHQIFIGLKKHKKLLFHDRWYKSYSDQVLKKPELIKNIADQNELEKAYIYEQFLAKPGPDQKEEVQITADDIKIQKPAPLKVNVCLGRSMLSQDSQMRSFQCETRSTHHDPDINHDIHFDDPTPRMKDRLASKNQKQTLHIKSKTCIKGSEMRNDTKKSSVTKKRGRPVVDKEPSGFVRTEPNMTSESASVTKNDIVAEQKNAKLEEMKKKIQENKMKAADTITVKPIVEAASKNEKVVAPAKNSSKNNDVSQPKSSSKITPQASDMIKKRDDKLNSKLSSKNNQIVNQSSQNTTSKAIARPAVNQISAPPSNTLASKLNSTQAANIIKPTSSNTFIQKRPSLAEKLSKPKTSSLLNSISRVNNTFNSSNS